MAARDRWTPTDASKHALNGDGMSTPARDNAPTGAKTAITSASPTSWWPYVLPMLAFLLMTSAEGYLPTAADGGIHPTWYPLAYAAKVLIVTVLAIAARAAWIDLRPWPSAFASALAVGIGLLVTVGWVALQQLDYPKFGASGTRIAFDPYVLSPAARAAFLAIRLFGLVLLVPLVEELFWRSFVLRMVVGTEVNADFFAIPIGRVTPIAAVVTAALFASAHPEEWLPAVLTGLAWAWLLWKTKSLSACVLSHAVANLGLGIYVLATGDWRFW